MKVLFVGEGHHDIGKPKAFSYSPRPATGVVPVLAHRVCSSIEPSSVAVSWSELVRFNPKAKQKGFARKIPAAMLVMQRYECGGGVFVADRDGDTDRLKQMEEGATRAKDLFSQVSLAFGLAIESIEAWTLGAADAIAEELGMNANAIRKHYPKGISVESLSQHSGKPEHRSRDMIERIANTKHRSDSLDFRRAVAERTAISALERACPLGFKPFADQLRAAFSTEK